MNSTISSVFAEMRRGVDSYGGGGSGDDASAEAASGVNTSSEGNGDDVVLNVKDVVSVHVTQEEKMDCGLACVRMLCRWLEVDEDWLPRGMKTPLWTIDVYWALDEVRRRHREFVAGVRRVEEQLDRQHSAVNEFSFSFHTTCIEGVDVHHEEMAWYCVDNATSAAAVGGGGGEFARIRGLFRRAAEAGWDVRQELFDHAALVHAVVQRGAVVVVLVDNYTLLRTQRDGERAGPDGAAAEGQGGGAYMGHYVLVVGYDARRRGFLLLNPAQTQTQTRTQAQAQGLEPPGDGSGPASVTGQLREGESGAAAAISESVAQFAALFGATGERLWSGSGDGRASGSAAGGADVLTFVPEAVLDAARMHPGTDADVVVVLRGGRATPLP